MVRQQQLDAVAGRKAAQNVLHVMRVPRMTGFPIITLGLLWTRGWSIGGRLSSKRSLR
jgi:hypothetical protein